eukprot:CAMPEP_0117556050 /NCGR_PEP_ID=MMETSP0784-20121206/51599_1 /TAXON_ID=39447 /ORGANISM="" /LENGTH=142 /DNA_ID=CAMNT_0005353293 /DNA_START=143 /DNA_END=571 /DNA_ORIENTATION=-
MCDRRHRRRTKDRRTSKDLHQHGLPESRSEDAEQFRLNPTAAFETGARDRRTYHRQPPFLEVFRPLAPTDRDCGGEVVLVELKAGEAALEERTCRGGKVLVLTFGEAPGTCNFPGGSFGFERGRTAATESSFAGTRGSDKPR